MADEKPMTDKLSGFTEEQQKIFNEYIKPVVEPGIDHDELMRRYQRFADKYDEYSQMFGYIAPRLTAVKALTLIPDKNTKILDACAGAGTCGAELYKLGYKNLDYLDDSEALMKEAKKRNIYKRFIKCFLGRDKIDAEDNSYDACWCVGAMCPSHITEFSCFKEFFRVIKPGGILFCSIEETYLTEEYRTSADKALDDFVKQGLCSWEFKGEYKENDYTEVAWVMRVK